MPLPSTARRFLLLAAAVGLGGCVSVVRPYGVSPFTDEFTDSRGFVMQNNLLPGVTGGIIAINAGILTTGGSKTTYTIQVDYRSSDWMFIEPGESLVFLLDGERYALSGVGSVASRTVVTGSSSVTVREWAPYIVSASDLRKIAAAHEVKVRIVGSHWNVDRALSEANLARFREFVAQHVDPHAGRARPMISVRPPARPPS